MDVAAWLRGLRLEQYAPAFRDNDVDGEVLLELTVDDLVSIGVTSVGHRRKLLAAIAALGTEPPAVAQSATSATSAPNSPPTIDAERRQRRSARRLDASSHTNCCVRYPALPRTSCKPLSPASSPPN